MSFAKLLEQTSKQKFKITIESEEEKEKIVVMAEVKLGDDYRSLNLNLKIVED